MLNFLVYTMFTLLNTAVTIKVLYVWLIFEGWLLLNQYCDYYCTVEIRYKVEIVRFTNIYVRQLTLDATSGKSQG